MNILSLTIIYIDLSGLDSFFKLFAILASAFILAIIFAIIYAIKKNKKVVWIIVLSVLILFFLAYFFYFSSRRDAINEEANIKKTLTK